MKGNGVMINATEMAKPFGKRPAKWLELPSTKEFLSVLQTVRFSDSLIQTIEGKNGGTWMHEDVALEFARWLSPKIAIWCNERIKELLRHGFTATDIKLEEMINNPDLVIGLASKLKEERARSAMLERKVETVVKENNRLRPKAELMEKVLDADERIDIGQSAKILNLPFHLSV